MLSCFKFRIADLLWFTLVMFLLVVILDQRRSSLRVEQLHREPLRGGKTLYFVQFDNGDALYLADQMQQWHPKLWKELEDIECWKKNNRPEPSPTPAGSSGT